LAKLDTTPLNLNQHTDRNLHVHFFFLNKCLKNVFAAAANVNNDDLRPVCLDCYLIYWYLKIYTLNLFSNMKNLC